jgi:hypothetical protein
MKIVKNVNCKTIGCFLRITFIDSINEYFIIHEVQIFSNLVNYLFKGFNYETFVLYIFSLCFELSYSKCTGNYFAK